jgi:hypothetical protein
MRLLEISKALIAVERKIVSIIPTIFSFALLLGVLIFIYGIIGVFLFSHHKYNNADFTTFRECISYPVSTDDAGWLERNDVRG